MDSAVLASWIAAAFAGATFVFMLVEKYIAWKRRPSVKLAFEFTGTAMSGDEEYEVLEVTNNGQADARFGHRLIFRGATPHYVDGYTLPKVLRFGETQRLLVTCPDREAFYVVYIIQSPTGARHSIAWEPVSHSGPLADEFLQQKPARRTLLDRLLRRPQRPRFVGPGGVPWLTIHKQDLENPDTVAIALGEKEEPVQRRKSNR